MYLEDILFVMTFFKFFLFFNLGHIRTIDPDLTRPF